MSRSVIIAERLASRGAVSGAAVSSAIDDVSNTGSNVVTALGVGFGVYLMMQYVVPGMLGAATQTKRAARGYREAGGPRREISEKPVMTKAIVKQEPVDAEFIDD